MDDPHSQGPFIIIVTGPPGTGKTWLSKRLAHDCGLPGLHRVDLKELLFDTLGIRDRAWSRQLGGASYELLFHMLTLLLQTGQTCLVESNFYGEQATTTLCALVRQYRYRPIQILCRTDPPILVNRLRQRAFSGERHPGHADHEDIGEVTIDATRGFYDPLPLDGACVEVDTTDFATVDYAVIMAQIATLRSWQR